MPCRWRGDLVVISEIFPNRVRRRHVRGGHGPVDRLLPATVTFPLLNKQLGSAGTFCSMPAFA